MGRMLGLNLMDQTIVRCSGLTDELRWLEDLFGLPLLLKELDAMRTVGEDELLSNVVSAEKGRRLRDEIWERF
ncbi:hypothetical protein Tco_0644066 [Tanacetum coccineum]